MAFGVFILRTDSPYDDIPAEQYQFPKLYLSRARQCEGDWVVYLEPSKVQRSKGYFAVARVKEIIPDPRGIEMYLAVIEPGSFLEFGSPVPFRDLDGIAEQGLLNDAGKISGRAQSAVRTISPIDFSRIVKRGLDLAAGDLPRTDNVEQAHGFAEAQTSFDHPADRIRFDQVLNRAVRNHSFRKVVLRAYDERCAISGLRLINGGGRAEVEAAHCGDPCSDAVGRRTSQLALGIGGVDGGLLPALSPFAGVMPKGRQATNIK